MHIKKYTLLILFLISFLQAKATGQDGDVIIIDGEEWELLAKPISFDRTVSARFKDFLPKNRSINTGNWDGYTAYWEIEKGYLYLLRVEIKIYNKTSKDYYTLVFNDKDLRMIFAPYYKKGKICARWVNGTLRAGQGNLVRYVHLGFDRDVEKEMVMTMKEGKVQESTVYNNYKKPGLSGEEVYKQVNQLFPWDKFPEYKGQKIVFFASKFNVTSDGKILDCNINMMRPSLEKINEESNPLVITIKNILKSIHPWGVLYINNQYKLEYPSFSMAIENKNAEDKK